ncbi:extracellular solute-binding protein [Anaplasmataceae bacterium AB001_6]|nr:extracellular solute-binding protein [Anaplasmataceae bacterium AB001_6]
MKKLAIYTAIFISVIGLWFYNKQTHFLRNMIESRQMSNISSDSNQKVLNIYSSRKEALTKEIFDEFTNKTGIKVNYIIDDANKLIARIESEGENTPADVLLVADVINLLKAEDKKILASINYSKIKTNKIPNKFKSAKWLALTKRVRCIVYNKDNIDPKDIENYENLSNPMLEGQILITSSNVVYNQSLLASIIADNGEQRAKQWTGGLVRNFARDPKGGETDQIKAVMEGDGNVAVVNSYYVARVFDYYRQKEKDIGKKIGVLFPNQGNRGSMINISGIGIIEQAKHKEEAIEFIKFMISPEIQKFYAEKNHEYPVVDGVEISDILRSFGKFREDNIPLYTLRKYTKSATRIADEMGWQ